jgi:hypothetical protein
MTRFKSLSGIAACALALLFAAHAQADADIVFSEKVDDYQSNGGLRAAWTRANGSAPSICKEFTDALPSTPNRSISPSIKLGNGLSYREIGQELRGSWTLSVDMLHSHYLRGAGIAIIDATGKHGYLLIWDSGKATNNSGKGTFKFYKQDLKQEWSSWKAKGALVKVTSPTGSTVGYTNTNHAVIGYGTKDGGKTYASDWEGFAHVTISFDADLHKFTVRMDDDVIFTYTDSAFTGFSRVYLRGNSYSYFDNVELSTP